MNCAFKENRIQRIIINLTLYCIGNIVLFLMESVIIDFNLKH